MIEKAVLNYLNSKMNTPVYAETPAEPPVEYIIVEKTGCDESNFLYQTTLAIRPVTDSLIRAASLDKSIRVAMAGIIELSEITRCKLAGGYNHTNTATKKYRYQSIYELVHY